MKLLFDENLSPRLVEFLSDHYPGSAHVHECGLGSADDAMIWDDARSNGFIIVPKDSDFEGRNVLLGFPPKVIWLRAKNRTSAEVAYLLRNAYPTVERFIVEGHETCLALGLFK